jgi:hypothetical protein
MVSNQQKQQKRQALSVRPHIDNQKKQKKSRGVGCVQLPDGFEFLKFTKEGVVRLDILPYRSKSATAVDGLSSMQPYHVHKQVGSSGLPAICPRMQKDERCPICEYSRSLNWSDPDEQRSINANRPQLRYLFNVLVEGSDKIQILDQSDYSFTSKLFEIIDNADESDSHYEFFSDLEIGSTLKLNIKEQTISNGAKYFGVSHIEIKERTRKFDESWLDKTVNLEDCLVILPYNELKAKFHTHINSIDEEPEPDEQISEEPPEEEMEGVSDFPTAPAKAETKKPVSAKPATKKANHLVDKWADDDDDGDVPF